MTDELRALCESNGGFFLRAEALACGYSDQTLASNVRCEVIRRFRRGAYAFAEQYDAMSPTARHFVRALAVLATSRTDAVLSHTSALIALDCPVWELPLDDVHLTRFDRRSGRKEAGVRQHRGFLLPEDLAGVDGIVTTSPTRTAVDLTRITDVEHCLPVFDHLLHVEATSKELLEACATRLRYWADTLATDLVVRLADGRRESVAESRCAYLVWRSRLPAPQPQYEVTDGSGRVLRLDFAWPALGVWLEVDGEGKYFVNPLPGESEAQTVLRAKRQEREREELIVSLTGWRCIRITWADLCHPARTAAYIESVLRGARVR